jgi:hypothetical protein
MLSYFFREGLHLDKIGHLPKNCVVGVDCEDESSMNLQRNLVPTGWTDLIVVIALSFPAGFDFVVG